MLLCCQISHIKRLKEKRKNKQFVGIVTDVVLAMFLKMAKREKN